VIAPVQTVCYRVGVETAASKRESSRRSFMKITFIGHAGVELKSGPHAVLIDPWITGNPVAKHKPADFRPNAILLSHGHSDHLGDAVAIAQRASCPIIAIYELAEYCQRQGASTEGMNMGGPREFDFGRVMLTPAFHSSSYEGQYLGMPCGIVLTLKDGKRVYHAGDTALFSDMALIGRPGLDLACLPIGSNYTMDPEAAFEAVQLLKPKHVLPIHYNTFPLLAQNAQEFKRRVESHTVSKVLVLRPGESAEI
jgi:L-ascorbate metabolism protein UlaG (beta-lactamase superfamily)